MHKAPKSTEIGPRHLSTQELADRLGIPLKSVYYWRATHTGPRAMRVGKYVRYRLEDVLAWEQAQLDPSRTA